MTFNSTIILIALLLACTILISFSCEGKKKKGWKGKREKGNEVQKGGE